ncbi:MAG: hypothetical protein BGO49_11205 [Planctomycetales bacterium 71-10]|nr:MAG: hypothetical protein BGO49_11205 [Planctomycetales bacterium 71-10]
MRGRKPKPTAVKIAEGTRKDRINFDEPRLPPGDLEPPDCLDDDYGYGREHWMELAPMLSAAGLLTEGDRHGLALMCRLYARFRLDPLDDKAIRSYQRLLTEFGLTPSSRSRIKAPPKPEQDKLSEFIAGFQATAVPS